MKKVFIDGSSGTTGLRIWERIGERTDIELLRLPEAERKDPACRRAALNAADIVFLCLPDVAAIEAVGMIENADTVVIYTSTAHRTAPGWVYGFPELSEEIRAGIAASRRIAVPGCHASGFIALVKPLDEAFVRAMAKLARERDILLIADEVQCGNGRSGKLYAYMHYGITPDIVTTAKGLGGGLPLGATLLGERFEDVFSPGLHGSTFGGNPVACAGALYVLSQLDGRLLGEVTEKAAYIFRTLEGAPGVESVTGLGLMIGIKTQKPAREVADRCMEQGVLVLTAKDKVRLLPALNIPAELLQKAVETIKKICAA